MIMTEICGGQDMSQCIQEDILVMLKSQEFQNELQFLTRLANNKMTVLVAAVSCCVTNMQ